MLITKTKLGYFVCDKQTYQKVKRLRGYYLQSLQQAANWRRWHAKKAHNRIIQLRSTEDGKTTLGLVLPKPEPRLVPVFSRKEVVRTYYDSTGQYIKDGMEVEKVSVCDMGILALYEAVRKPKKHAYNLPEVTTTIAELDDMLKEIQLALAWW